MKQSIFVVHARLSATLKVSNPDRLIDAASGTSKIELVRYYGLVGALMLVHLKGRPVSLASCFSKNMPTAPN